MSRGEIAQSLVQLIIQLITCMLLTSCLTPYDFRAENNGGLVVISGQVSNLSDQNMVEVGVTAGEIRLPIPENNANVVLYDDEGNSYVYNKDNEKPGVYTLPEFSGEPGKSYFY